MTVNQPKIVEQENGTKCWQLWSPEGEKTLITTSAPFAYYLGKGFTISEPKGQPTSSETEKKGGK